MAAPDKEVEKIFNQAEQLREEIRHRGGPDAVTFVKILNMIMGLSEELQITYRELQDSHKEEDAR